MLRTAGLLSESVINYDCLIIAVIACYSVIGGIGLKR